jgi:hypothetical protein
VRTREHPLELEIADLPLERARVLGGLGARGVVARLLGELVERARVLERAPGAVERADARLELRLLLEERLRLRVVVPEAGALAQAIDLADADAFLLDVKATPGAPRGASAGR